MNPVLCIDEIFYCSLEALLNRGYEMPSRDGPTRELVGLHTTFPPQLAWLHDRRRALSPHYAAAEILWYLSSTDRGEMIKTYASQYGRMLQEDGASYGAYGKRLTDPFDQISGAIRALKESPDSRRVAVVLWRPTDLEAGMDATVKDVPCTLVWQFLLRDKMLCMLVYMRSNDAWLGLPYDAFWNCLICRVVAAELGVEAANYHHIVGSYHLYDKHAKAAEQCLSDVSPITVRATFDKCGPLDSLSKLRQAADMEVTMRETGLLADKHWRSLGPIGQTLVALCAMQLEVPMPKFIHIDPVLKEAAKRYADHRRV